MPSRSIPAALVLAVFVVAAARADGPVIRDQGNPQTFSYDCITSYVMANDFALAARTRLSRGIFWLSDYTAGSNGVLDGFGGLLGWAVYAHDGVTLGAQLASGTALAPRVRDAGFDLFGGDVAAVEIVFDPAPILPAGDYWIALHEGTWGGGNDGSEVCWVTAPVHGAGPPVRWASLGLGEWYEGVYDNAFLLLGVPALWDQSALDLEGHVGGAAATGTTPAGDFVLTQPAAIAAAELWLVDDVVDDDAELDNFDGTLGWGILAHDDGEDAPAWPALRSGTSSELALVDAGIDDAIGRDVVRARFRFDPPVPLSAGHWWFGAREGTWAVSGGDFTPLWWHAAAAIQGSAGRYGADNGIGSWQPFAEPHDLAFALYEEPIFGSGFESGTGCAWQTASPLCP